MVRELGLQKSCYFKGYVPDDDLVRLYNTADVYVRLAEYEGFGMPSLEAKACGCPVITTDSRSLLEVVGDAGIIKGKDDVDGITDAAYVVLTNEDMREAMIKKGLQRSKMFSWEKIAEEHLRVYDWSR